MEGFTKKKPVLNKKRYCWYLIDTEYCPVCGSTYMKRTRMFGLKPLKWEDSHKITERYDYCDI